MVDWKCFVKAVNATVIPSEMSGIALALFLFDNPNKIYKRKDTYFTYCEVNRIFLYCKPNNRKREFWYTANGLDQTYKAYIRKTEEYKLTYVYYRDEYFKAMSKLDTIKMILSYGETKLPF